MKKFLIVLFATLFSLAVSYPQTTGGGSAGGGSGTVTSVDATTPSYLAVSGNPVTTAGTLAFTSTLKDTVSKAVVWTGINAADTLFIYRVDKSGLTARSINSKRVGGTIAILNVIRVRAGVAVTLRSADFTTTVAVGFLTPMQSWSTLQNTTSLIGDEYYAVITTIVGPVTDLTVQITFDRTSI